MNTYFSSLRIYLVFYYWVHSFSEFNLSHKRQFTMGWARQSVLVTIHIQTMPETSRP
ncbi:hypothetical protein AG1IA_00764 [Rhizoctonia solani AG-1 IA]|uniref:Uncharacterized protein n=1 Tax=Thanatephorus cucumeris (strain AG1-IA) TaxID=983506 RepID=L8X7Y6_THACA|nr:hypothetical protein AG1IA_00764 [Rhizoctonia solani AG-1 IA]